MKASKLMILLLLLNLGLILYMVATRAIPVPGPGSLLLITNVPASAVHPSAPPAMREIEVVTNEFRWRQLESEDYPTYIGRLRSVGCPEQTIRDIIIADLDKLFSPRLHALYPYRTNLQYWQPEEEELLNDVDQHQLVQQQREIESEKRAIIKELMGIDLIKERTKLKGQEDLFDRRLAFLSEEKRPELRAILEDAHDQDWRIRQKQWADGLPLSPEDRETLSRLRQEKQARLSQILSPQELAQYEVWMSETSFHVRHDTYAMDATEQEFLSIFKLRKDFDQQWNRDDLDMADPNSRLLWEQANAALDARIESELGPARFVEYKRGQDPEFHALSRTVARYNLPREKSVEVYDYKAAYFQMRDEVGFNPQLTSEQKDATFRAIYEETTRAIRETLGERAFAHYRAQADWLKN